MVPDQVVIYPLVKDRIHFLQMAVKHPVFGQYHDIRRHIAKWYFYEYVNVTQLLTALAMKHYGFSYIEAREQVSDKLFSRTGNVFRHPHALHLLHEEKFAGFDFCEYHVDIKCILGNHFTICDTGSPVFKRPGDDGISHRIDVVFDIWNPKFVEVLAQFRGEVKRNERKRRKVVLLENVPE